MERPYAAYTRLPVNGRNITLLIICMDSSRLKGQTHHLIIKSDRRWDFTIYAKKLSPIKNRTKIIILSNYKIINHIKIQSNNPKIKLCSLRLLQGGIYE